jgi:hypothetical protein
MGGAVHGVPPRSMPSEASRGSGGQDGLAGEPAGGGLVGPVGADAAGAARAGGRGHGGAERATLVAITDDGRALVDRVLPGHIQVTRLLFDPLTGDDLHHLGDIMTRVRDHMRAQPPRSAAPRKHRPGQVTEPP